MLEERVNFRGENNGVHLIIEGSDFSKIVRAVDKKLKKGQDFYKGAQLLSVQSEELTNLEKIDLAYRLKYKFGFILDQENISELILENKEKEIVEIVEDVYTKCETVFITRTIRSGQVIKHPGSVVIIGDVNPGARVEAGLNIIVLGNFRGSGSAGSRDENSLVAAYRLNPAQLKISDKLARSPDGEAISQDKNYLPEVARIINGKIVIEPYLPNK